MVYPDPYNYDLPSLTRAREEEGAVVESISRALGSLVERLYTKTEMMQDVLSPDVSAQFVISELPQHYY